MARPCQLEQEHGTFVPQVSYVPPYAGGVYGGLYAPLYGPPQLNGGPYATAYGTPPQYGGPYAPPYAPLYAPPYGRPPPYGEPDAPPHGPPHGLPAPITPDAAELAEFREWKKGKQPAVATRECYSAGPDEEPDY